MSSTYEGRPWLKHYSGHVTPELDVPTESAIEMFERTVAAGGDRPALHYFDWAITYNELNEIADAFAVALQKMGIRKGDRVAVYLQNVPQFVVTQYAVWKCGAILTPLNPMLKKKELASHLNDCGAKVLVCLENLYDTVMAVADEIPVEHFVTTSELDFIPAGARVPGTLQASVKRETDALDFMELVGEYAGQAPDRLPLTSEDVAYLNYTSGTTGPPKGAMNTHQNVVFNANVYRTWMDFHEDDVVLGVAPLFHITGMIAHLMVAAASGTPVVLFYRFDAPEVLRLIEHWQATFTVGAITVFTALMDHPDVKKRDLSSFTKCYSGGAPIAPSTVEQFEEATGVYIHNVYGLTETTSPSHAVPLGARAPVDPMSGALSIGVPVPNTVVRIVDIEEGETELEPGQVGEIVIKGPMVVPGYWNRPEESQHAIRDAWLYTGDVGVMDEDGWFYIVDRKKDMIVASGYKVWPREVEDVLYEHPAVKEAAVIGVPDEYRGETVKACVTLKAGQDVNPEELIQFCKDRMAAYKYPRQIRILAELPKTTTGKFLRRELRARERRDPGNSTIPS